MKLKVLLSVFSFACLTTACGSSNGNNNGYGEEDKGKGDTSTSISGLQPDSAGAADRSGDTVHLDENLDQRGTRIHAGKDSLGKKQ